MTMPTAVTATLDELVDRARHLASTSQRRLLGITGSPGAGKTTLGAALLAQLGARATLVEMDAFHLANSELIRLARRDRKGAPDTFDVGGYVALLRALRSQTGDVLYAPRFDRALDESIGSAVAVSVSTPLIVTEGNYLLMNDGGWEQVRETLDEVWFLDVPEDVRAERLIDRHHRFGKTHAEAAEWTNQVDLRNAELIEQTRTRADLVVQYIEGRS
ncbi:MAG: nucleoside/nucleotide kinase family protein [Mycobacterium sp.]